MIMMMLIIIIIFIIIIIIIISISEQGAVHFPSNGVGYAKHYLHAFPSEAGTRYVYDRFDTGPCGTLHTSIAPQPPTVKDWILARVMSQGCSRLDEFDLRVLLQWGIGKWTQAVHTLPGTLGERYLDVMTGNIFLNFPWPHIIWRQWHCYSPHRSTVCHRESLVYRWWAEPAVTPEVVFVGHPCGRQHRETYFIMYPRPTMKTLNSVFSMMTLSPLLSMPSLHALSLVIHSSCVSAMSTRSST